MNPTAINAAMAISIICSPGGAIERARLLASQRNDSIAGLGSTKEGGLEVLEPPITPGLGEGS
jgi:hypothetical protein